jgi:hypothetical protein
MGVALRLFIRGEHQSGTSPTFEEAPRRFRRRVLGTAEVGAGSVSLLYILASRPRRDPRPTSMIKLAFAAFLLLIGPCSIKSSGLGREAGSLGTKTNPDVAFGSEQDHDR